MGCIGVCGNVERLGVKACVHACTYLQRFCTHTLIHVYIYASIKCKDYNRCDL